MIVNSPSIIRVWSSLPKITSVIARADLSTTSLEIIFDKAIVVNGGGAMSNFTSNGNAPISATQGTASSCICDMGAIVTAGVDGWSLTGQPGFITTLISLTPNNGQVN